MRIADYRFYLLDENARFRGGESFSVTEDTAAAEVAAAVHNGCADVFDGYELWRGTDASCESGIPFMTAGKSVSTA